MNPQVNTTTKPVFTIANSDLQLGDNALAIASALVGKTVRYLNAGPSTVRQDGCRTFKVEKVDKVFTSNKNRKRCVTALVRDVDDAGEAKYRTLQLAGISAIV